MSKQLNVDLLRTFHAVARFRRFNEAAQHVHRSASTVTTQIQKLEALIGADDVWQEAAQRNH
jgi:DNA-binding transcriptional LysR family regulator